MAEDLGARLIRAGLLSRGQLARALAGGPVLGGALVAALVDDGLPEEALVGFFVSETNAVQAADADLGTPDSALVRLVPRAMADALCALPLRRRDDTVLVALADPTDKHAQAELGRALGASVAPLAARLTRLRAAIGRAYAQIERENASIDVDIDAEELFDEPPVELVRRKPPVSAPPSPYAGSTRSAENRVSLTADEETHMPLVRTKPVASPAAEAPSARFDAPRERTRTQDRLGIVHDTESTPAQKAAPQPAPQAAPQPAPQPAPRAAPQPAPQPAPRAAPPARRESRPAVLVAAPTSAAPAPADDLLSGDRWSTLPAESARPATDPAPLLVAASKLPSAARQQIGTLSGAPPQPGSLPDVGPALAAIRGAASRDEAVRLACDAALPACRCAVFLALKRDVLQGREVVGGGVSREAIYNLWIPVTSASVFREAITHGTAHFGPYGTTAADGIYKAAIGAIGGDALVQPVAVAGKAVAVLCADDLRYGSRGRQRVESLALALGEAFERLIVSKKK